MKLSVSFSAVFLFLCFSLLVMSNQFVEGRILYAFLILLVFVGVAKGMLYKAPMVISQTEAFVVFLAFCIVLSWTYGIFLGGVFDVPKKYLFVNFAGMFFYTVVISWFLVRPAFYSIMRVFLYSFFIQLIFGAVAFYGKIDLIFGGGLSKVASVSELRSTYSLGFAIGFPMLTVSLYSIFKSVPVPAMWIRGRKSAAFIFMLSLFLVVVPAMSKGFILAVVLFCAMIFCSSVLMALARKRASFFMILFSIFSIFIVIYMFYNFIDIIVYSFSAEEGSNAKRAEQAKFIIEEITPLGAGLGAELESGYSRPSTPYGFELTYLNILHKLGVFSLPLFFAYLYCFFESFKGLFSERKGVRSAFSLGLMGYAIVGIGNPILLGGLGVFFHTLSIYLLASSESQRDLI